jgi:AcrR family transcriptional regulator
MLVTLVRRLGIVGVVTDDTRPRGRRAEYAAQTRQAIIDSARSLYASSGYFATTVEAIAAAARVAPATVYAVGGGKHGLLHILMEQWQTAPVIQATYQRIMAADDPEEILRATAAGTREVREEWADVMRVALNTAPHDPNVAASLAEVTGNYRAGIAITAKRLAETGALKTGLGAAEATDTLWFYFGYSSYFTLTEENHWTLAQAEQWLLGQARSALLRTAGRQD